MERRAYGTRGLRTQDGNIVVITSPDGKGYEVYENENGLEMYLYTVPKAKVNAVRDTLTRIAILKHEKAEIEAARRVVGRFMLNAMSRRAATRFSATKS